MLKAIRIIVSVAFFSLLTFLFLDFAGLASRLHVLAHLQFIPAWLAHSLGIMIFLLLLTVLFGRVYCSSICPMGIFQDIAAWLSKKAAKKKKRYAFSPAKTVLRWTALAAALVAFFLNFPAIMGLIDPYSAYGRMAASLFKPIYMAGNNLLALLFTCFGNYTFYKVDIVVSSLFTFATALVTFLAVGFLAWKHGRTYCNTICPVGTILGLVGRYSLVRVGIDSSACNGCGVCAA
ncbi:MAG: 4Fe-4S binding protein, partial [Prevotella sp.]|nr:4Fe-4S binding protein [Prevotella sp.]